MYQIREWEERYEVNSGNSVWKPGQKKRDGDFDYYRAPCSRHISKAQRRLNALAGAKAPAVMGVWDKLMGLAATNKPELRGKIVETDGTPMSAHDIAETLMWDVKTIEFALNILSSKELQWIEVIDSEELLGSPRISYTEQNRSDQIKTKQEGGKPPVAEATTSPESASLSECPELERCPAIAKKYLPPTREGEERGIRAAMLKAHPKSPIPKWGSVQELDARKALADLVAKDKFSEQEVLAVLAWLFKAETEGAQFWLQQFHSLTGLRKKKHPGEPNKFTKMYERMRSDEGKAAANRPKKSPEMIEHERVNELMQRMEAKYGFALRGLTEEEHQIEYEYRQSGGQAQVNTGNIISLLAERKSA